MGSLTTGKVRRVVQGWCPGPDDGSLAETRKAPLCGVSLSPSSPFGGLRGRHTVSPSPFGGKGEQRASSRLSMSGPGGCLWTSRLRVAVDLAIGCGWLRWPVGYSGFQGGVEAGVAATGTTGEQVKKQGVIYFFSSYSFSCLYLSWTCLLPLLFPLSSPFSPLHPSFARRTPEKSKFFNWRVDAKILVQ